MRARSAYLDIETSWRGNITVVGVYRPGHGTRQLVRPDISRGKVLKLLRGVRRVVTFSGKCFDLPRLRSKLRLNLLRRFDHVDLRDRCRVCNLRGGLKKIERRLGIRRHTRGVDGGRAMDLWWLYRYHGDDAALKLLLRYNRDDVENLERLERKLARWER